MRTGIHPILLCAVGLMTAGSCCASAQQTFDAEDVKFFETGVRPVLRNNCFACHNEKNRTSGLSLESRESIITGGNRGPAVQPGQSEQSLLIAAIGQAGALKMPPAGRLKDEQIAILRRWVDLNLPWPTDSAAERKRRPGADHWAFQPLRRPPAPPVKQAAWVRNPIDAFILARLEEKGLAPSPEADKRTLIRRVSLDLIGLPPSPKEIESFLADSAPGAYERLVDRLLASPHYGERWGRHWLDLARYADSDGYTIDGPRQIWKYRDWVIQALNRDMPFDRFVIEQVAGDLLPNPAIDQLIATGFHRNTPSNYEGGIDFEQYRVEAVVDRVATTGAAFLGLTLGCARCHDHKYDPISQREFYQLYAFLNNIDEVGREEDRKDFHKPILDLPTRDEAARLKAWEVQRALLTGELEQYSAALPSQKTEDPGLEERKANLAALERRKPRVTSTLIMRELPRSRQAYIHLGGDFLRKGAPVSPGVPGVLPPLAPSQQPNRLGLARWLVDSHNPLTPRVTVNRLWQRYFGAGLVATENDFGAQGDRPSHPELLDWLASEFMERGWSLKAMHRLIVTSATYRQASHHRPDAAGVDPDNRLLARQNRLRLDAEIIRDAALVASGLFTPAIGGPSVFPPIPPGALSVTQVNREWKTSEGPDRYRRGMYTFLWRSAPHPGLTVFDAPNAVATCTRRERSNTPLQALTLLNDEAFFEFAQALGTRILKEAPADEQGRFLHAFELTLGRPPKPRELDRLSTFLAARLSAGGDDPQRSAWIAVSRVLLNLDEFMTRE